MVGTRVRFRRKTHELVFENGPVVDVSANPFSSRLELPIPEIEGASLASLQGALVAGWGEHARPELVDFGDLELVSIVLTPSAEEGEWSEPSVTFDLLNSGTFRIQVLIAYANSPSDLQRDLEHLVRGYCDQHSVDLLSELTGLTETARDTIERKQESLAFLVLVWPYISIALLVCGAALIIFGLIRWKQRQSVQDRMEDLSREKLEEEVRHLTPLEVSKKIERERQEEQVSVFPTGDTAARRPPTEDTRQRHEEFRARILEVESLVVSKLVEALSETHVIKANMSVRSKSGRVEVDVVAESRSSEQVDLVIEIRYSRTSLLGPTGEWVLRAASNREIYSEASKRDAWAVLWLVVEETRAADSRRELTRERIDRYNSLISPPVLVLLHSRQDLEALTPSELRKELAQALVKPEW
jgi:hypothetical protein